jgi:mono/diheme cytochrome c family protein
MRQMLRTTSQTFLLAALAGSVATTAGQEPAAGAQTRSVWDGVYTEQQAARAAGTFSTNCARCHGAEGGGGEDGRSLTGDAFWQSYRESTVDHLFTYVRENMPNGAGGSLSTSAYLDLVAFILNRNGFPAGAEELTEQSTIGVQIIAETGPGELPATTLARVVGCLARDDSTWVLTNATPPERVEAPGVGDTDATRELGTRTYPLMFVLTSLQRYVGHRMSASGLLLGEGGADGLNVMAVQSVAESCQ